MSRAEASNIIKRKDILTLLRNTEAIIYKKNIKYYAIAM